MARTVVVGEQVWFPRFRHTQSPIPKGTSAGKGYHTGLAAAVATSSGQLG